MMLNAAPQPPYAQLNDRIISQGTYDANYCFKRRYATRQAFWVDQPWAGSPRLPSGGRYAAQRHSGPSRKESAQKQTKGTKWSGRPVCRWFSVGETGCRWKCFPPSFSGMPGPDKLLAAICLSLGFALAGCSKTSEPEATETAKPQAPAPPAPPAFGFEPIQPKVGAPISTFGAYNWIVMEARNLMAQGKLNTHLMDQAPPSLCRLRLPPVSPESFTPQKLFEKAQMSASVLALFNVEFGTPVVPRLASGFFITDSGAFVTCSHCLSTNANFSAAVMARDGRVYPVKAVLAASATNDVAILEVEGKSFTPIPVGPNAPIGSSVWVLSNPGGYMYTFTSGTVSGYVDLWHDSNAQWPAHAKWMTTTADFAGGSSGAPVLNENGAVVGVASLGFPLHNYNNDQVMSLKFCVPAEELLKLVQRE
ncbi:MAG: hypothetical protein C5B50_27285 [Verrucomicrobia bacterium]|nr:MAG: hypothetical protein C5B50_27285 [Verrucomicrobiota bacterium]